MDSKSANESSTSSESLAETMAPTGGGLDVPVSGLTVSERSVTVLPSVRQDGERLVVNARNELRYESQAVLGRGGMGEVELVRDNDIGRSVAVKRLIHQSNAQSVARFVEEVQTIGTLEHPNIPPVHDVGVDDQGRLFFVMKYVQGETLGTIIKKLAAGDQDYHRRFTFDARLTCFVGLLRALQYAHNQGIIHRDIKLENVMVGPYGEVMLMDWGLAQRRVTSESDSRQEKDSFESIDDGSLLGTPSYMSPEQARGELSTLDERSDLYSAFVVLFELLTTKAYVESAESVSKIVAQVADRQPPQAYEARQFESPHQGAVPTELRFLLRRGLANAREDRFESAEAALLEIERLRSGSCAVNCPVTFVKATSSRFERIIDNHPLAGLFAVLLISAACLSGAAGWITWGLDRLGF